MTPPSPNPLARRACGLLLHPTSLPGPYGIGEIGPEAVRWIHTLANAGQTYWQILPLGPTGYGDSPYQCFSSFAGNPLLIALEPLVDEGFLAPDDLAVLETLPRDRVDFPRLLPLKVGLLTRAAQAFEARAGAQAKSEFIQFQVRHSAWLDDYALFTALKFAHGLRPWTEWASELTRREVWALIRARRDFATQIAHTKIIQFYFERQWRQLQRVARSRGVKLIGDVPIFAAMDSSDVWSNQYLFDLLPSGRARVVAGVPPDYFSTNGQRWGNPLYAWPRHAETHYAWWAGRLWRALDLCDVVRIDHFRGFAQYFEIPGSAPTAVSGRWVDGPGMKFFEGLKHHLSGLPLIAEDLGVITPEVEALRDQAGFPGMRILQFAFGNDPKADDYKPHNHVPHSVVYTGTHDNDTIVGWWKSEAGKGSTRTSKEIEKERKTTLAHTRTDGAEIHWDMIRLALTSRANTAIIPVQDVLGLGTEARMNTPGTTGGNWTWRFRWEHLEPDALERLRRLARDAGRLAPD